MAGSSHHAGARFSEFRLPRLRRPLCTRQHFRFDITYLNKQLNDIVQSQVFRSRMAALGMTVPPDNTPQMFADYIRRETIGQRALAAALTGIKMMSPAH